MADHFKPIETRYDGCRFRSRTEARWAVFFNALGWRWEFEPEGFRTASGPYLPDFRIHTPNGLRWLEVKPWLGDDLLSDPRWKDLAAGSGLPVLVVYGMHRTGDGCVAAWRNMRAEPHAGRVILPNGHDTTLGPFWTTPEFTHAWDAASSARFEFGESG